MRKLSVVALVILAVVLVGASGALAKKAPVDVGGLDFAGSGKAKGKIKGFGSEKGPMSHTMEFGPQGGLAANQFLLTLDDGVDQVQIPGTYALDAKNKYVLTPDPTLLEDRLTDLFWLYAGGQLPGVSIDLDVTKVKMTPKPKESKKTGAKTLKLKVKFVFDVHASGNGQTVTIKTTVSYGGK